MMGTESACHKTAEEKYVFIALWSADCLSWLTKKIHTSFFFSRVRRFRMGYVFILVLLVVPEFSLVFGLADQDRKRHTAQFGA